MKPEPKFMQAPTGRNVALDVKMREDESPHDAIARHVMAPEAANAGAIMAWTKALTDINAVSGHMQANADAVHRGNLRQIEAMLLAQAETLNTVFTNMMCRCAETQALPLWEARMRVALKAQAQCRSTLEALAEVKIPRPVAFVKQANIAQQQQVNNGVSGAPRTSTREGARAGEGDIAQSRLLEATHGERLDTGATGTAGRTHPHLAAVGAVNRAEERRR